MSKHLWILICLLSFSSLEASAAVGINWNQPEVVPEKLMRNKRRVMQFSGTATPGMQLRIRDNKVKMIFSKKNIRWARIPQKHRVQFPVIASDTGYFSFQLYLPTTAVEIPFEVFRSGKWMPYRLSFEVPEAGAAEEFRFTEESFKVRRDEENVKVEDFLSEYDKTEDMGQVVNDRGDWKSWTTGKILVWGSLGVVYSSLEQTHSPGENLGTLGGFTFPAFELGGEYRWSDKWKAEVAYAYRAGDTETDGAYALQNSDLSWTTFGAHVTYYPSSYETETYRFGAKGGIQIHEIPYVKRVGNTAYRIFSNDMMMLAVGGNFETMRARQWNYDVTALLLYPFSEGGEFDLDSGYGVNLSASMVKELIPALSIGGKIDMHWLTMESSHADPEPPALRAVSDSTLWQLTPSFIIKAEF